MYHFAYGSNMNIFELKKYLCDKDFKIIGPGYLENYIFTYRSFINRKLSGKANIEKRINSKVYGLIVKINKNCKRLDKKEGIHLGLYHKQRNLKIKHCNNNKTYKCFSYIMDKNQIEDFSNPSKKYRQRIMSGASMLNLPITYIKNRILKIY
jgi:hypothetical protein